MGAKAPIYLFIDYYQLLFIDVTHSRLALALSIMCILEQRSQDVLRFSPRLFNSHWLLLYLLIVIDLSLRAMPKNRKSGIELNLFSSGLLKTVI